MGILISTTYNLGLYQEEGRTWPCYLSMKLYLNTERGSPVYTCSLDAQGGHSMPSHVLFYYESRCIT